MSASIVSELSPCFFIFNLFIAARPPTLWLQLFWEALTFWHFPRSLIITCINCFLIFSLQPKLCIQYERNVDRQYIYVSKCRTPIIHDFISTSIAVNELSLFFIYIFCTRPGAPVAAVFYGKLLLKLTPCRMTHKIMHWLLSESFIVLVLYTVCYCVCVYLCMCVCMKNVHGTCTPPLRDFGLLALFSPFSNKRNVSILPIALAINRTAMSRCRVTFLCDPLSLNFPLPWLWPSARRGQKKKKKYKWFCHAGPHRFRLNKAYAVRDSLFWGVTRPLGAGSTC